MLVRCKCDFFRDSGVQSLLIKRLQEAVDDDSLIFISWDESTLLESASCILRIDTDLAIEHVRFLLNLVSSTPWFSLRVRNRFGLEILMYSLTPKSASSFLPGRDLVVDCASLPGGAALLDMFPLGESRSFNAVVDINGHVEKSSAQIEKISEEFLFLTKMNQKQIHLYPQVWDFKLMRGNSVAQYCVERIFGSTFSSLLLAGELRVEYFFEFLDYYFEQVSVRVDERLSAPNEIYVSRLRKRNDERTQMLFRGGFSRSTGAFALVKEEVLHLSDSLSRILDDILLDQIGPILQSEILHGDMVFSNIIRTTEGNYRCIDPRGLTAERLPFGLYYDLAKLLQCLISNYDSWLQESYLWHTTRGELFPIKVSPTQRELLRAYRVWLTDHGFSYSFVKKLCLLHLYALIPLHEEHPIRVFAIVKTLRQLIEDSSN